MMSIGLSTRDRRTLIIGASAVGALLALGRGVPSMMRWQSTQIAEAAAAAVQLAAEVENLADESAVKISAMQLQADSARVGALVNVGVRVTAIADVFGLLAFMRAIDGGERMLLVRELVVTQPEPAALPNKAESLRIELTVVALARVASEKP